VNAYGRSVVVLTVDLSAPDGEATAKCDLALSQAEA
jgi:hypothetical protein